MAVRVQFNGRTIARRLDKRMQGHIKEVARKYRYALEKAEAEIKKRGVADIKKAGNFGPRWIKSFTTQITPRTGVVTQLVLNVFHKIPYAGVHEFGAVIRGKPLLWIPLPWTRIKVRAKVWAARFGGLFRVDRKRGNPLLLSIKSGEPKYVGVKSVRLRQRFHVRKIVREVADLIPRYYRSAPRGRRN